MAKKPSKKKTKVQDDGNDAMEVCAFRMAPETRAHLRGYAKRAKLTQGELLRRFVTRLPRTRDKLRAHITVNILPVS